MSGAGNTGPMQQGAVRVPVAADPPAAPDAANVPAHVAINTGDNHSQTAPATA
jgi:hypothetical protein